jgi:hypothetical protein
MGVASPLEAMSGRSRAFAALRAARTRSMAIVPRSPFSSPITSRHGRHIASAYRVQLRPQHAIVDGW